MLSRFVFSLSLFLLLFPSFLLTPQPASAAAFGLIPCALQDDNQATNWDDQAPCTLCHFLIGMNFVVKFLRNLMTAIAIAIMVAMAIMYIVSAGNEEMMATAKKGIIGSLIGIVVILLAWVIVNFIFTLPIFANNGLVKTDGSWDTFTCNTTSQVGWTGKRNTSSIGNGAGSVGSGQPGREGLPGAIPEPENPPNPLPPNPLPPNPLPPNNPCGNGHCGDGNENCFICPEDCGICKDETSKCGEIHFTCDNDGEVVNQETLGFHYPLWKWSCYNKDEYGSLIDSISCSKSSYTCGSAIEVPTLDAPTDNLCADHGTLIRPPSYAGFPPFWEWVCSVENVISSCRAFVPSGTCRSGTYYWAQDEYQCSADFPQFYGIISINDNTQPNFGSALLYCTEANVAVLNGGPTCYPSSNP